MTTAQQADGPPPGRAPEEVLDMLAPARGSKTDVVTELEGAAVVFENPRHWRRLLRGLLTNPSSLLGTLIILTLILVAIFAPVIAPCPVAEDPRQAAYCGRDPYQVPKYGFSAEPLPPSPEHPFGTTKEQYDIFYGVVWGTRTAFKVGIVITACALLLGLTMGAVSAYFGGWVDEILMRIVEIFQAFPFFLAAITLATILKSRPEFQGILPAVVALIAFGWTHYARLLRADVLSVKERDFVWAARSLGASDARIIMRHVLPNSIYPVMVVASLDIGTIVVTFAALSFFGVGVPAGYADWGQMISSARDVIPKLADYWYLVIFPGAAIVLFSLSWNLIGDAFRDLLDPRLTGGRGG